jgi:hypothetical protein
LPEFSLSGYPDLDHIGILQAEMISQINVSDDLDDPRISSILRRSRRRPQERSSMIETNQVAGKQQYVPLATVLFSAKPNENRADWDSAR